MEIDPRSLEAFKEYSKRGTVNIIIYITGGGGFLRKEKTLEGKAKRAIWYHIS
jgi:hypothetical protein